YAAFRAGHAPALPPVTPLAAYNAWYAKALAERGPRVRQFWLGRLGAVPTLTLPGDTLRPARRGFTGARLRRSLGADDLVALKALCRRRQCSAFTVLLATWAELLSSLSGQRRFAIGVASAGQSAMGAERLVGQCAAMLPLPVEIAPGATFPALLESLKADLLRLWDHQDIRPEDVAGDGLHLPPLRAAFNQDRDPGGWEFPGATARLLPAPIGFVKCDLFLNAIETGDALLVDLDYDAELFAPETAAAWIDLYVSMLRTRLAEAPADAVPAVLAPIPFAAPVLARIARHAAATPDRAALIRDGMVMTYAELQDRLERHQPIPVGSRWIAGFPDMDTKGAAPLSPAALAAHVNAWIAGAGLLPGELLRFSDSVLAIVGLDAWAAPLAAGATIVTGEGGPSGTDLLLLLPTEAKAYSGSTARLLLLDDGRLLEPAVADLQSNLPEQHLLLVPQPKGFVVSLGVAPLGLASSAVWRRVAIATASPALAATIRDAEGRPVLPGAVGMLHIAGIATGSAARFGADGGVTLLGTGDLAVAEVSAVLLAHPAVLAAVTDGPRVRVAIGDSGVTATGLRRHLLRQLPVERLPVAFAVAPILPSLDDAAWESGIGASTAHPAATEEVTALFRRILRQDVAGPDDDFFDLGGDSLSAMLLVNALRDRFGQDLPQAAIFEAPTPASLAARLGAAAPGDAIPRITRAAPLRLSAAQRRLWFLDQLGQDGDAYVMGIAIRLEGALDTAALRAALADVVARHEILRTTFPLHGDLPLQAIRPPAEVLPELPVHPATEATLPALLGDAPRFDLAADLPLRAVLYRLGRQTHVLALRVHHIAGDGWSLAPLARDLAIAYAARRAGMAPDLPPPALQYTDLAAWAESRDLSQAETFWRDTLAGLPAALDLPYDLPRAPAGPRPAGHTPLRLDPALAARIRDLAHEEQATPFMVLQAALATLLMRYGAGEDIPIGAPVANRPRAEAETAIGLFVNTVVLRCRLDGRPSFRGLLRRLRATDLAAFGHQDLPFERVVEMLRPQREAGGTPLFQVMLMLGQDETHAVPLPGLRSSVTALPNRNAKFDLVFGLVEDAAGGIAGSIEYDASRFLPDTAARLARHFAAILAAAVAAPDIAVQRLRILAPAERRALLAEAGPGATASPDVTVTALLDAQAAATPDATAVIAADGTHLSYAALHAAADRVAGRLAALGIGPGDRVVVACPRGPEMVTGILGVLKSGAAYVPVDPSYPAARIAYLLEDATPAAVLTAGPPVEGIAHPVLLRLDAMEEGASATPREALPEDAAYVIYTSGSTGRPKGVVLSHRAVASYLCWARDAYRAGEGPGAPINTSIGFDATVTSLFLPLISGTAIRLIAEEDELQSLAASLRRDRDFTLVKLTPAHLDILQHLLPPEVLAGQARLLVIGGEALPAATIRFWRRHAPATRLVNEYGPTETTVGCIVYEVATDTPDVGAVPIGRPTGNARVYLLDGELEPVPSGAIGEIHIGGAGVADGYLGRPELTAERFLPDPFAPPGAAGPARMYRSGDRARRRADGMLVYLGREDGQIKLRGHRMEPGEIEAALLSLPGIAQAAVALRQDGAGDLALAGFLVAAEGIPLALGDIRAALHRMLPAALVPADLVWLPALPLSPNGKVDRARLAALPLAGPGPAVEADSTPAETILRAAFANILGLPDVGAGDDFFALGGHSMLAAQLVNRLRPRFGAAISLGDLFAAPTPAGLARRLSSLRAEGPSQPALRPMPTAADHPASANQRRLWLLEQLEPGRSSYNILGALALDGPVDAGRLRGVLAGLAARHESLRTELTVVAGEPRQRILRDAAPVLICEDLSTAADPLAEARAMLGREALTPIPFSPGPLWRARLLRLSPEGAPPRSLLVLNLHHAIADGWSLGVLLRDFGALWNGRAGSLPSLPVQYRDFAVWQAACLATPSAEADLAWWLDHLRGTEERLDMPADRPRGRGTSGRGAQATREIDAAAVAGLRRLAAAAGTTLFPVQLALVAAVLHRYTGRTDLTLGTVVAGRDDLRLHDQVGFFANTLALRLAVQPQEPMADMIRRVGATVAEALRHAATPFERVVEALGAAREPGRTPIFDVLVAREPALELPVLDGLSVAAMPLAVATRHFDLALYFRDGAAGIDLVAEYDTDLFDAWRIEALLGHIVNLAGAACAAPDAAVEALDILAPDERRALLTTLSGTVSDYPRDRSVVAIFRAEAQRRPSAIALRHAGGGALTYAELDDASDRVAAYLAGAGGIARGALVGIAAAREPALIAGILGILKAGAAYVPIDPDYPAARIAAMLEAAPLAGALTDAASAACLPPGLRSFALADAMLHPLNAPTDDAAPDDLAYVMFTSGSTGRPKPVTVPHRAVLRLVLGADYVTLGEDERLLQTGAISFDAATFEIWSMLLNGGTLVLAEPRALLDAGAVKRLIADHAITTMWLTGGLFNNLVDSDATMFAPLRQLLVGGERLSPPHVARVRDLFPALRLLNGYGPTENTTFSCVHAIGDIQAGRDIPIGRPIANSRAWILGPGGHPAPVGVPGEICVGGDGLAQGYLGQDELTRERFVAHPGLPDERIYRTGDFGCWMPDGSIAYLGRRDRQVKVRGVRVETAEVEAALMALPGVTRATVVARTRHGLTELVAYLVGPAQAEAEGLLMQLRQLVPPAALPAHIVAITRLPVDPNGKLDHASLPQPEDRVAPAGRLPANPLEAALCRIWAEVLGRESIGPEENFFELGGHSLLAMRLVDRIRGELRLGLDLRDLFAAPTVAALAPQLLAAMLDERLGARTAGPPAIPILSAAGDHAAEDHAASATQRRLWFLDRLQGGTNAYNIFGAWRLRGVLDAAALRRAFAALLARHEALRTVFTAQDGEPRQRILRSFALPLEEEGCPTGEAGIAAVCAAEAAHVFDLGEPLFRARLLRVTPDDAVLLINCHHLISDGHSMQVLQDELPILYAAARDGGEAVLAPAPSYRDAVAWMASRRGASGTGPAELWWRQALAGPLPQLDLPTDHPRPAHRDGRGAVLRTDFPQPLAAALTRLAAARGTTLFGGCAALVAALMHRICGQDDIVLGTPVANRDAAELGNVVGFLADTLPLRCQVQGGAGFTTLLGTIAATLAGAISHPAPPFDELVGIAGVARDPSRSPLFDVMVTLAEPTAPLMLPMLDVTPLTGIEDSAQFDLTFRFQRDAAGLSLDIAYATDIFGESRIARIAGWLLALAQAATTDPERPLAQLPLLTAGERQGMLRDFAQGPVTLQPDLSLVTLFEAQADRTPDVIAVSADKALSYRVLDERANELAADLLSRGIARGDRIGLAVPASAELLVGILGILKAGAAYVPLDPAQPPARLHAMLEDAGCRHVVGGTFPGLQADAIIPIPTRQAALRPDVLLSSQDLAYVIFTSGSTGRPKGVMVGHGAVANLVRGLHAIIPPVLPGDTAQNIALLAAPVFDASVQQIFPALLGGHTLYPAPANLKQDPAALLRFFHDRAIAIADGTPTLLDLLLDAGLATAALPHLRHLILGGETLRADALRRLRGNPSLAGLSVSNAYGPTECTVDAALFTLSPGVPVPDPVPIGRPLPNVEILVLDPMGEPSPAGLPGEIWIAGAGLARGYAGGVSEEAARFADHPFAPGQRIYRSGDRGFWRDDGQLVFLGRRDAQMKIRGHRLEAAEVEAAMLAAIPTARQAAVVTQGSGAEAILVGWVGTDERPDTDAAHAALRALLPQWMVPAWLACLPSLPLTPSGKIDRRALALRPLGADAAATADAMPEGALEAQVAAIWEEVLDRTG
ncbi:MAG: non-ribosomal peptide synthetase, partial [Roseomonas sp.]|nr:non-ribosomal peptide synthetase [Roseomonas sp.]